MAKRKNKTISTKNMVKESNVTVTFRASHKTKEENIHEINNNINRGVGVVTSKKKQDKNFRKEKHRKNTRDFI